MVKVYYEQKGYAQVVAYFDDENTYHACIESLEKNALENNFEFVTESVEDFDFDKIYDFTNPDKEIEKTFYLLGSEAVRELNENGIDSVVEEYEANELSFATFCFVEGETKSHELAEAMDGWNDFAIISEEEYNKLQ